jgi:hypothetical protein
LIVKISLNPREFSRKTNHEGEVEPTVRGVQRKHETPLSSFRAFVFSNRRFLCGSKFFNVLVNFSPWKLNADALPDAPRPLDEGQEWMNHTTNGIDGDE